jgi:hypothetical protein
MDIKVLSREDQQKWMNQRGWVQDENRPGMWINPDTRMPLYWIKALDEALAQCRLPADTELRPEEPAKKPTG